MDGKYMVNEKYSFNLSNYARDLLSNTTNIVLMLESYLESTLFIKSINCSLVLFLYSSVYTFDHLYNHKHQMY